MSALEHRVAVLIARIREAKACTTDELVRMVLDEAAEFAALVVEQERRK